MAAAEFNPDLPVVVAKEFDGYDDRKKKKVSYRPGDPFDWQALGIKEDRVGAMVRARYLRHSDAPLPRAAKKQEARNAAARAGGKPARKPLPVSHAPARRTRKG